MEAWVRLGAGVYTSAKYWSCKQCKFEGRLVPIDKYKGGLDKWAFSLVKGIQLRWESCVQKPYSDRRFFPYKTNESHPWMHVLLC